MGEKRYSEDRRDDRLGMKKNDFCFHMHRNKAECRIRRTVRSQGKFLGIHDLIDLSEIEQKSS